jgi:hypothetical protein
VFSIPTTNEVWLRVVGMLVLILGYYYIQAGRKELTLFFRWTVYGRSSVIIFFIAFVALGFVKPVILLFGAIDLLGAIWTGVMLASSNRRNTAMNYSIREK